MDSQTPASNDRLHSWKEIAAYLKRDVTTVRRWEKREGLPVHRHLHDRRDSVYAFPAELDGWLEGRRNTAPVAAEPRGRAWPGTSISLAIAAVVVMSGALVAVTYLRTSPPDTGAVRVPFSVPHPLILADAATGGDFSISPDGRRLAFVSAAADGTRRLWIRPLDSLAAVPLAETEGAANPFWSPDGEFVAFFAQRTLKKIASAGGPVQILADAVQPRGGTWNAEGVILFAVNAGEQLHGSRRRVARRFASTSIKSTTTVTGPTSCQTGGISSVTGRSQKPGIYLGTLDSPETRLLATGYISAEYSVGASPPLDWRHTIADVGHVDGAGLRHHQFAAGRRGGAAGGVGRDSAAVRARSVFDLGYGYGDATGPPVIKSRSWSGSIAMAARSALPPALAATSVPRCRRMKRPSPSR